MQRGSSLEIRNRYSSILSFLNERQFEAATAEPGHLLINAAAGTGKTTTIAARILYLQLAYDVEPSSILAISFSRAARSAITETLDRLSSEAGKGGPVPTYTFHGLAFRMVRFATSCNETWLRPGFSIIDPTPVFKNHATEWVGKGRRVGGQDILPEVYAKAIDMVRQGHPEIGGVCLTPDEIPASKTIQIDWEFGAKVSLLTDDIKAVWKQYQRYLKQKNMIDYPGLILEAIHVFNHERGITRRRVLNGLTYIVVDEYQDTSRAQELLLFQFLKYGVYLNVVGDNDQAIYTFNGSDVSNILEFTGRLQARGMKVLPPIDLEENYRSTEGILMLACRVVEKGRQEKGKRLLPFQGELPEPVQSYREANEKVRIVYAPKLDLAASFVAREIERLIEEGVPAGEISVLVRKDSQYSPQGEKTKESLELRGISTATVKKEAGILADVRNVTEELCQNEYHTGIDVLIQEVQDGVHDEDTGKNMREPVLTVLGQAKLTGAQTAADVIDFLYESSMEEEEQTEEQGVQIRTVHSAKGLEFRVVFLMYLGDGSFPHGSRPDIEEERRLLYVGVTRAMERLYVIGHPGIKSADFFGECRIEGTEYVDYSVEGGRAPVEPPKEETEEDRLICIAREQQKAAEKARRELLRAMMEDF